MSHFYTGNIYLNNLAKHKLGKSDKFSEIVKVIKIKSLQSSWNDSALPGTAFNYICASAPILNYNDQRK